MATGELADALHRDLLSDRLELDDLGWRGLWAYITTAQPGTAIYHERFEGWTTGDHIAAEHLSDFREYLWRFTVVHFEGGKDIPFPDRVPHPGIEDVDTTPAATWETVELDDLVSPEVRQLLRGGAPFQS